MPTIKTHEQYTLTHGNFMVVATVDLTQSKPRITLCKPDSFAGAGRKDYHFELSQIELLEGFAKCALEAVNIARSHMPKEVVKVGKKLIKGKKNV